MTARCVVRATVPFHPIGKAYRLEPSISGGFHAKKSLLIAAPLALALIGAAVAQQASAPLQPSPVKRTPVGKVEVPGSNYEVITAVVELQPGFKASPAPTAAPPWARMTSGASANSIPREIAEQLTRALREAVVTVWSALPQDVQHNLFE
jgi:hypothetical protein